MGRNDFFGMHRHHIVFKSHGGLDFKLNMIGLTQEEHEGDKGPHRDRERDLELKRGLQATAYGAVPGRGVFHCRGDCGKAWQDRALFCAAFQESASGGWETSGA